MIVLISVLGTLVGLLTVLGARNIDYNNRLAAVAVMLWGSTLTAGLLGFALWWEAQCAN